MKQTVLPFKLEITRDEITAHAGLALFGEFVHAMGILDLVDRHLPAPGSAKGYAPSRFVEPLLLMLQGGGRALEDLRQIRQDTGLREVVGLDVIPSSDAVGDWLRRMGVEQKGLTGLGQVHRPILRRMLHQEEREDYTLDLDASQIVAEKQEAKWTYKGERGYMPMVGHLAENGLVIGEEFREGNQSPGERNLPFIQHCVQQLPKGKRIARVRADSATYQAAVFNWCEQEKVAFAIGAVRDEAVVKAIESIPEEDWREYQNGSITETVHSMNETKKAFRLIVVKRPVQADLLEEGEPAARYHVIASNREETAEETVAWYNQRGEASENKLKELKIGFGMERMPCGQFAANAVFFRLGVLAYNLFVYFKTAVCPSNWRRRQVRTVRWCLYQTAGKVTHHAGRVILKVRRWMFALFEQMRTKCWELAPD